MTAAEVDTGAVADRIRHHVLDMCTGGEGGHLGGSLSIVDILAVLYFDVLRVDPGRPLDRDRDIFILSKGHGALALYATLAERGYLPVAELSGYNTFAGRLMAHPVTAVPGVEMPTGSLGHGLSLGLGFALGAALDRRRRRVFVLLGDGELQEGSCWEAIIAAASHRTANLVAIVDRNGLQLAGETEPGGTLKPLEERWSAFGWDVTQVDGHDHEALRSALLEPAGSSRPRVVLADTVKGYGLPGVAGTVHSHYATLSLMHNVRFHNALADSVVAESRR